MLSEILAHLLVCHQEFLLENAGQKRVFSLIPISFNINKLWFVKILMQNGKLPPFFDSKRDENSNMNCRKCQILGSLQEFT